LLGKLPDFLMGDIMKRVIGFHYTLTDKSGTVLDSSIGDEPLYFLENSQQIIPGLEKVIALMNTGDKKKIEVLAADAYGDVNPELIVKVKKTQFPPDAQLTVGDQFQVNNDQHSPVFTIMSIESDEVTVDGNHPMAGKDLFFDVEIIGMREATTEEMSHGHAHGAHGHGHH
jgi:FKBP-type peptidyl-prolyl cis-trans isomerase SlyD